MHYLPNSLFNNDDDHLHSEKSSDYLNPFYEEKVTTEEIHLKEIFQPAEFSILEAILKNENPSSGHLTALLHNEIGHIQMQDEITFGITSR